MRDRPLLPDVICDVVPRLFGVLRCTCRRYKNAARVLLRACPMLITAVEAPAEPTRVSAFFILLQLQSIYPVHRLCCEGQVPC
jgi:hypothetical protein